MKMEFEEIFKKIIKFKRDFISTLKNINIMHLNLNKKNPLNWSILISGGKENNNDFLSNGEWKGKSPSQESNLLLSKGMGLEGVKAGRIQKALFKATG